MKRVIALIISIAMVASLATGLAVTGFADNTGITINGDAIEECCGDYSATILASDTNSITVDKIATWTNVEIYIPSGKTLIVSSTDIKAIDVQLYIYDAKDLTITGGGTLVVHAYAGAYSSGCRASGIYASGNITISNTNVVVTHEGESRGSNTIAAAIYAEYDINIINKSIVTATNKGTCGGYGATFAQAAAIAAGQGSINITGGSTVVATHEGDVLSGGQLVAALYANIDIKDGCTVNVNVNANASEARCFGIYVSGGGSGIINVSCTDVTVNCSGTGTIGIYSRNEMNFTSGSYIKSKGKMASFAVASTGSFKVDGNPIDIMASYTDYFTGTNLSKGLIESGYIKAITGTDWVYFGTVPTGTVSTGIKINGKDLAECYESYGVSSLTITDDGTVIVDKITTDTDININILEGKTLIVSNTDGTAIDVESNVNITGGGTLEILAKLYGIQSRSGNINIDNSTVIVTATDDDANAIYTPCGSITINNSNITANAVGSYTYGINAEGGNLIITPTDGNTIQVSATNAFCADNKSIYVNGEQIDSLAKAKKFFESCTDFDNYNIKGSGFVKCILPAPIDTGIKVNGVTITDKNYGDYGITLIDNNFDYENDTLTIACISTNTDITIIIPSGKTLKVSSTDDYGINVSGKLTIDGAGTLDIDVIGIMYPSAIKVANAEINGGILDIYVSGGFASTGISATSNTDIFGGEISIISKKGHGISSETINISGGKVTIVSATNSGIYTKKDVNISGGEVVVEEAGQKGIDASGNVKISDSNVTAAASGDNSVGIYAGNKDIIILGNSLVKAKGVYGAFCTIQDGSITYNGDNMLEPGAAKNGTPEGNRIKVTSQSVNGGYVTIGSIPSGITINGSPIETTITNFGGIIISKNENTVTVDKISKTDGDVTIVIPQGKTLIVSNTDVEEAGIFAKNGLTINGEGTLKVYADISEHAVYTEGCVTISVTNITLNGSNYGIFANNTGTEIIISNSSKVKIKLNNNNLALLAETVTLNGSTVLNGTTGVDRITIIDNSTSGIYKGYVWINTAPKEPDNRDQLPAEEEEQSDPEVDIDFGFGPVAIKTSDKSIVLDDKRTVEKIINETAAEAEFISFDLTKAYIANTKSTKEFDGLFLNNEAYRCLGEAGKGIEIINRFAKAEVFTNKEVGNNPLSFHLPDVSNVAGKCSTAIQKRAMQTHKVYAEVYYSFVTNGNPTENDAKIYVPVDGESKVFYLFNENKIGIVPCEVKDGYCVFDRYFDGTYVVCSTK